MGQDRNCPVARAATTADATASGSSIPLRPAVDATRWANSSSGAPVIPVHTPCGQRQDTVIPSWAWVMESHSASATTACLVTL